MKSVVIGTTAMLLLALAACNKSRTSAEEATNAEKTIPQDEIQNAEEEGQPSPAEIAARNQGKKINDDAPYYTKLQLNEFMPHVMQYAGDGIWKHAGYIIDKNGEHSLFPKNDEEWEQAESGARTLAEVTNVLLIPGRRVPEKEWDQAVLGVRAVALRAADAAERKDADAFFKAGGDLDEACDVCHIRYDPKFKPNANAAATGAPT